MFYSAATLSEYNVSMIKKQTLLELQSTKPYLTNLKTEAPRGDGTGLYHVARMPRSPDPTGLH